MKVIITADKFILPKGGPFWKLAKPSAAYGMVSLSQPPPIRLTMTMMAVKAE